MAQIERNDCIDTALAFYDHAIGYETHMEARGTATLERTPPESSQDDELQDELVTSAELAECTCPDWCARDHDRD
jgi:hypothetical protein